MTMDGTSALRSLHCADSGQVLLLEELRSPCQIDLLSMNRTLPRCFG